MSHIDELPPLREVIETYGLAAKKALGQNFLLDFNITMKIAREAEIGPGKTVVEIGPGPGGLTRALLASGAKKVIVVEKDSRCIPALENISKAYSDQLEILEGDALSIDFTKLNLGSDVHIVANLPYNIATPLLTKWIEGENWPPFWRSMTLMFQKEVADRITATPGDKHFGRLAVLCGWRTSASRVMDLPPQAFWPPPKVTSSVVRFEPVLEPAVCSVDKLTALTRHAFGQRRKMLRSSLKQVGGEDLLVQAGIDPTKRAEEIEIADFVKLANLL